MEKQELHIDFEAAKAAFETYLDEYDRTDDKIHLKIVHTYCVVECAEEIATRMYLGQEDVQLAKIIGLLHDIGRFEQLKQFDSFEPTTMDHAAYGVQILFEEGMIRRFMPDDRWDEIIRTAIVKHSDFVLEGVSDPCALFHARLIRDADKLDNFRVKLEDDLLTFMGMPGEEIGALEISPKVYETVFRSSTILSADRITKMDYWVSYLVHIFDLNFKESMDIVAENNYIEKLVHRIPYTNPVTARQMQEIQKHAQEYIKKFKGV